MAIFEAVIKKCKCERCGKVWIPRKKNIIICPSCKSPYWNMPRRKKATKR